MRRTIVMVALAASVVGAAGTAAFLLTRPHGVLVGGFHVVVPEGWTVVGDQVRSPDSGVYVAVGPGHENGLCQRQLTSSLDFQAPNGGSVQVCGPYEVIATEVDGRRCQIDVVMSSPASVTRYHETVAAIIASVN